MMMEMTNLGENPINWLLIGIIIGSVVLGSIIGFFIGRRAMKKRDI